MAESAAPSTTRLLLLLPRPPPAGLPRWSRRLVAIARLMHAHQIGTVFAKLSGSFRPRRVASTSSAPVVVCCIHQQRAYVSVCQYIIGTYIQRYMQTCKHTSACTSAALPSTDSSIVTLTQQLLAAVYHLRRIQYLCSLKHNPAVFELSGAQPSDIFAPHLQGAQT